MASTRQEQPAIHGTRSTGLASTLAPLPTRTTSVLLQNPTEDVIPYSHLITQSALQSIQCQPIPEHASPAYFDIRHELNPGEQHFSPKRPSSIAAPLPENWSFADPLHRLMNPNSPSSHPENLSRFQPPYLYRLPRFTGALVSHSQSVFARPDLLPASPIHTPNPSWMYTIHNALSTYPHHRRPCQLIHLNRFLLYLVGLYLYCVLPLDHLSPTLEHLQMGYLDPPDLLAHLLFQMEGLGHNQGSHGTLIISSLSLNLRLFLMVILMLRSLTNSQEQTLAS